MTHDELIEAVALALVNRDQERFDLPRIETVADFRCQEDAAEYLANARAAIRVIAPAVEQETVAKIVAWLRIQDDPSEKWALQNSHWYADEIEAKFGGRDGN